MRELGGARARSRGWLRFPLAGLIVLAGSMTLGKASAGSLEKEPGWAQRLEALAFDPFRLTTDSELLSRYAAVFSASAAATADRTRQPTAATTAHSQHPKKPVTPVTSSTTAGVTTLTSAAALVKAFVGQAFLISPRPPLRTPTQPTWP